MTLSPESIETSRQLATLMAENDKQGFDRFVCSLSVEDLLQMRWFLQHRHAADMAAIEEAIRLEEARREQETFSWEIIP